MDTLGNVIALSEGQAATDGSTGTGRPLRIESVDVKGEVNGRVGPDIFQHELHDATDTISVEGQSVIKREYATPDET